jgi:hypothetical protein
MCAVSGVSVAGTMSRQTSTSGLTARPAGTIPRMLSSSCTPAAIVPPAPPSISAGPSARVSSAGATGAVVDGFGPDDVAVLLIDRIPRGRGIYGYPGRRYPVPASASPYRR